MSKYMRAIVRHEKAAQAVRSVSVRIGDAIRRCPVAKELSDWNLSNARRAEIFDEKTGRDKTHVWQVFNAPNHYGEHLDRESMLEELHPCNGGCRHCYRAFKLIEHRKTLRGELGNARRAIRALGRNAIKTESAAIGEAMP